MEKGENAGEQHFLLFPQGFQESFLESLNSGLYRIELTFPQNTYFLTHPNMKPLQQKNLQKKPKIYDGVESIVGKVGNAVDQDSLDFPQCFQKRSLSGSSKPEIAW